MYLAQNRSAAVTKTIPDLSSALSSAPQSGKRVNVLRIPIHRLLHTATTANDTLVSIARFDHLTHILGHVLLYRRMMNCRNLCGAEEWTAERIGECDKQRPRPLYRPQQTQAGHRAMSQTCENRISSFR